MEDGQREEFSERLQRIGVQNRQGAGFEATGTLGRSETGKRRRRRGRRWLRVAIRFVVLFTLFKGGLMALHGMGTYTTRIESMKLGNLGERLGGMLMDVDPVSRIIADLAQGLFG